MPQQRKDYKGSLYGFECSVRERGIQPKAEATARATHSATAAARKTSRAWKRGGCSAARSRPPSLSDISPDRWADQAKNAARIATQTRKAVTAVFLASDVA